MLASCVLLAAFQVCSKKCPFAVCLAAKLQRKQKSRPQNATTKNETFFLWQAKFALFWLIISQRNICDFRVFLSRVLLSRFEWILARFLRSQLNFETKMKMKNPRALLADDCATKTHKRRRIAARKRKLHVVQFAVASSQLQKPSQNKAKSARFRSSAVCAFSFRVGAESNDRRAKDAQIIWKICNFIEKRGTLLWRAPFVSRV